MEILAPGEVELLDLHAQGEHSNVTWDEWVCEWWEVHTHMAITRVRNLGEALEQHLRQPIPPPPILTLDTPATKKVEVRQVHQPSQRLNVPCCVWGCGVTSGVDQRL